MKKYLLAIMVLLLLPVSVVSAAAYYAYITVTESSGVSYGQLPIIVSVNNTLLAANYYIEADGRDTRVARGSQELPHMVADNCTLFATPITADTLDTFSYTSGSADLTAFDVIFGYGGRGKIVDDSDLEGAANCSLKVCGLVADMDELGLVIGKTNAFVIATDSGNMTASINGTLEYPLDVTSRVDGGGWSNEANADDNNTATAMTHSYQDGVWTNYVAFYFDDVLADSISLYVATTDTTKTAQMQYTTDSGSTWTDLGSWACSAYSWNNRWLTYPETINGLRVRVQGYLTYTIMVYEVTVRNCLNHRAGNSGVVSSTFASGQDVEMLLDSSNIKLLVDDVEVASSSLSGLSIANTSYDYYLMAGSNIAVADNVTMSVGGVQQVWIEPNNIISSSTIPDRQASGGSNDVIITWGSNPVAVSLGALLPETQSVASALSASATDIAPVSDGANSIRSSGVEGSNLPFYDMFKGLLTSWAEFGGPTINMQYFWKVVAVVAGWIFGTAIMLLTRNVFFGITAYAVGFAVPAVAMEGLLDLWVPIVYLIGAIAVGLLTTKWSTSSM